MVLLLIAMWSDGKMLDYVAGLSDGRLLWVGICSAALKIASSLTYQRALQLSPMSLSVPYLAFTPVLLLITSYFLLGEQPSGIGVFGVLVMTCGAYLLNTVGRKEDGKVLEKEKEREELAASQAPAKGGARRATEEPIGVGNGVSSAFSSSSDLVEGLVGGVVAGGVVPGAANPCMRSIFCLLPAEPGSRLMLVVAIIWSLTSDLDKMGKSAASSFLVFMGVQRLCMLIPLNLWLLTKQGVKRSLKTLSTHGGFLILLALLEMFTVAAYLKALDHLYVSYAIAAKRSGILLSVLGGAVFFKEKIWERVPYITVMLFGMTLILLSGNQDPSEQSTRPS